MAGVQAVKPVPHYGGPANQSILAASSIVNKRNIVCRLVLQLFS